MGIKVVKFGGSSLASAEQVQKVIDIISADEGRAYVVPSAPGKRFDGDTKVTDLLLSAYAQAQAGQSPVGTVQEIASRYTQILEGLGVRLDLSQEWEALTQQLVSGASRDYVASRGEYFSGRVLAQALGYAFVEPASYVRFGPNGAFDSETTQQLLSQALSQTPRAVIPGFYGAYADGQIKTFSRGGSDVTGAIVARAVDAEVYENWTDVSGFLMADPRIVDHPKRIEKLTYRELRELSYMGAQVLHEDSIFPVRQAGIPIHILNTNAPTDPGTLIVKDAPVNRTGRVTGIAGHKGFSLILIEKAMMNSELGFVRRALTVLEKQHISVEHIPTGIDTLSVVVSNEELDGKLDAVLAGIQEQVQPDHMEVVENLALIATVGRGMVRQPGTAAALFEALASQGINLRMIDQGSSELNIIVGVDNQHFEEAVRAIYHRFVRG
jgi:aspartate kinase